MGLERGCRILGRTGLDEAGKAGPDRTPRIPPGESVGRGRPPGTAFRGWSRLTLLVPILSACELPESSITEPEDIVIAEAHLVITNALLDGAGDPVPTTTLTARVFLHRTFPSTPATVPASVTIRSADGATVLDLPGEGQEACRLFFPFEEEPDSPPPPTGSCYRLELSPSPVEPGTPVELEILTDDGLLMTSASRIPGAFELVGLDSGELELPGGRLQRLCLVRPETRYRVAWTPSDGAWAFLGETVISGLDEALPGVDVPSELFLNGLALRGDTSIVFPSDFGIFDRFDLDRDLSLALQEGLPEGTSAVVSITSADRNAVNWARGGNFNPSGAVRIPSIFGDGTGVFGTGVQHEFTVWGLDDPTVVAEYPFCGPAEP